MHPHMVQDWINALESQANALAVSYIKSNSHLLDTLEGVTERPPYCKYCFNARVYKPTDEERMHPYSTELTDENDFSSCSVGHCFSRNRRFMIDSGHGHPVNIEFEEWTEKMPEWHRVGIYYPKYCPECGRKLDEYENKNNND